MEKKTEYFKVLAEKPDIRPKKTITLAEKIITEYKNTLYNVKGNNNVAIEFSKLAKDYKNTSALARMLGKFVKKLSLEGVKVVKDEKNVYLLKD